MFSLFFRPNNLYRPFCWPFFRISDLLLSSSSEFFALSHLLVHHFPFSFVQIFHFLKKTYL